jgi:hypothetical protein
MAKIRVRTTATDTDGGEMHYSKVTDIENSSFILLDSLLLKLLLCIDLSASRVTRGMAVVPSFRVPGCFL